jgi:hypothetical protein
MEITIVFENFMALIVDLMVSFFTV